MKVMEWIKDYAFQINWLLQNEVKRWKIQAKREKNAKCMALQCQMESSQQRQMRLQDISAHKTICSQLETLEKRAIILFFNLFTLVIFMKVDNIYMQLLYFITTVTSQVHSARHHQRAGYSALPSV